MKLVLFIAVVVAIVVIGGAAKLHRYDLCVMTVPHGDCMGQLLGSE